MRPSWEAYFLSLAKAVATRASCPRASVGAVIVSKDNRFLASGYNGSPSGEPHCLDFGCLMVDGHCQRSLHAEVNAVGYAARYGIPVDGARMYVAGTGGRGVCRECMKILNAAGVFVAGVRD